MDLDSILRPVKDETPLVAKSLREIADVDFPQLAEIMKHTLNNLGKGIRPALTLLSGKFSNYDPDLLVPMATAVELLHTATLVHDDTIDRSPLRRGYPTPNSIWGDNIAITVGDWLFAKSTDLVTLLGNLRVVRLFALTLMAIAKGELEETSSTFDWRQTREQYFQRITGKTASLFGTATESGSILAGSPESTIMALRSYGYDVGLAFQIVDDILDFTGDDTVMGKPAGNDLLQGILTLPAILFLERHPGDNHLRRGLESHGEGEDLSNAVADIRDSSLLRDCYAIAESTLADARQAIEPLPDGDAKRALIQVSEYVLERRK